MHRFFLTTLLAVSCFTDLGLRPAAAESLQTVPELIEIFPWEQHRDGVNVTMPVLMSNTVIIPAGAILRVAYVPLRADDDKVVTERNKTSMENSFTRKVEDTGVKLTPKQLAQRKVQQETVWPNIKTFQVAMGQMNADEMHLVFLRPDKTELIDEVFNLPQGLLLGESGGVKVLAVQKGSGAMKAGIAAGEIVTKVGTTPVSTLAQFVAAYKAAKDASSASRQIPMSIQGAAGERAVTIKLPMGLGGSMLDM